MASVRWYDNFDVIASSDGNWIFITENTDSETFWMEGSSEKYTIV